MKATDCRLNFDERLIYFHFENKHANREALVLFLFFFLNERSTPFSTNFIYTMVQDPILFGLIWLRPSESVRLVVNFYVKNIESC